MLTLLPGAADWTSIDYLPRPLAYAQASIVGGRLRVTGGIDGSSYRSEVLAHEIVCLVCPCGQNYILLEQKVMVFYISINC